jgi:protein TonB
MSEAAQLPPGEAWSDAGDADLSAPRSTRGLVIVFVALLHVVGILALIRAFAPDFTAKIAETVFSSFSVTVVTTPPPPPPPKAPDKSGKAAEIGKKAVPKEKALPKPKVDIANRHEAAPRIAGRGADSAAGARDHGAGTGAGGQGNGTGSGAGGNGTGGGAVTKAVKIAGDINSARDYPRESRDARIGDSVIVALTIGSDGRVKSCRVNKPSKDSAADQTTCRLASDRFRFKPATDANGNPVESVYGWQQKWFYPGQH